MIYTERLTCRLCGSAALDTVLDWGGVPLTGTFPLPGETVPSAPLHLARCHGCGLVQLRHSVNPALLYGPTYGYRSGGNPSMVAHLRQVANRAKKLLPVSEDTIVVDIGGNDGTLLKNFPDAITVNIDPSREDDDGSARWVFGGRFGKVEVGVIKDRIGDAQFVFSLAVLYDLDDPLALARQVRELLADDGLWVVEVADADAMLTGTVYDGICHEHLTYWSVETLTKLMLVAGFEVVERHRNPTNGGSLLLFCRKVEPQDVAWNTYGDGHEWRRFASRVQAHGWWLNGVLDPYKHKVYGLGASTKGNTLMHNVWFRHEPYLKPLIAIGEVNEQKVGRETPVGRVPIVTQAEALREADDLVVFPWHFREFFEETLRPQLRPGQRLIFPLPF